ncbi:MAG: substrate-binding domain-containing protein [Ruminococcus sp.]|nr:substrate-binding domain-containing protein [Ruminococcus sp.]
MKKSVTLMDIARECNTSNVTVSKALADKSGVSEELRIKIKQTAEEMGYMPAKSSAVRRRNSVGILVPERYSSVSGSFYWTLYNYLSQKLKREGMYCVMETVGEREEQSLIMPDIVVDGKVKDVISMGQISYRYAHRLADSVSSLVLMDYYVPGLKVDSVVSNGYNGSYKITNYLFSMGHSRIAFVGTKTATTSIFDRFMGYLKALIEHDVPMREDWIIPDRDEKGSIPITLPKEMPTAFVCNCDETAFAVIKALRAGGYKVPQDVSVVGYDDYLISEMSDPAITTVSVDEEYMAELTVQTLMQRLRDPSVPCRMRSIEGELVIKDSVIPLI